MAENRTPEKDGTAKPSKRTGPNPAHTLLNSLRAALDAGVAAAQIVPLLDMARKASGVKQAPVWRSCAEALDEYTQQASAQQVPGGVG